MNFSDTFSTSTPTKVLFAFAFVQQFVAVMYAGSGNEPLPLYNLLAWVASIWIFCWWLIKDSELTGRTWPLDTGYLLAVAWFIVIPYQVFRHHGLKKAMFGILAYVAFVLAGWLTALLAGSIFSIRWC